MHPHELSDDEWAVIERLLPTNSREVKRGDDLRVIKGILWRFRTGSSWRDVPERCGNVHNVLRSFDRVPPSGVAG